MDGASNSKVNHQTFLHDIFISYAEEDGKWVNGYLIDALEQAGIDVLTPDEFELGVPTLSSIEKAIKCSKRTLLVLSPAYMASGINRFINVLGQNFGSESNTWPVIPLIYKPVDLPARLSILNHLDATDAEHWPQVLQQLHTALKAEPPTTSTPLACPYPGMRPFSEAERHFFYGRDEEIEQLIHNLRPYPVVSVIGSSGCGKSSLVFAGLIPALRKTHLLGKGEWLIRCIRPSSNACLQLLTVLGIAVLNNADINEVSSNQLKQAVDKGLTKHKATRLLLVVDQLEELFSITRHKQDIVQLDRLLRILVEDKRCYVVMTARADFYAEMMESPLWSLIKNQRIELTTLKGEDLREAVVRPADTSGVYIESILVERLVNEAADEPGALPFVQETMAVLWGHIQRRFLSLKSYESLILSYQSMHPTLTGSGLQVAMINVANSALTQMSEVEHNVTKRIFLRLVQFGEGREHTRRSQTLDKLTDTETESIQLILDRLVDSRLLTLSTTKDNQVMVDISHESLIKGWPQLKQWVEESAVLEKQRRRLEDRVLEWQGRGSSTGGLLDNEELAEAQQAIEKMRLAGIGIDEQVYPFLQQSKRHVDPGWHGQGALLGGCLVAGVLFALFTLLYWVNFVSAASLIASVINTLWVFSVLFLAFVVTLRFKSSRHLAKQITQKIGVSGLVKKIILVCVLVLTCGFSYATYSDIKYQVDSCLEDHKFNLITGFQKRHAVSSETVSENEVSAFVKTFNIFSPVNKQRIDFYTAKTLASCSFAIDASFFMDSKVKSKNLNELSIKDKEGKYFSLSQNEVKVQTKGCEGLYNLALDMHVQKGYELAGIKKYRLYDNYSCGQVNDFVDAVTDMYSKNGYFSAMSKFKKIVGMSDSFTANVYLSLLSIKNQEKDASLYHMKKVMSHDKSDNDPYLYYLNGQMLELNGLNSQAKESYEKSIALGFVYPWSHVALAFLLSSDESITVLNKALKTKIFHERFDMNELDLQIARDDNKSLINLANTVLKGDEEDTLKCITYSIFPGDHIIYNEKIKRYLNECVK